MRVSTVSAVIGLAAGLASAAPVQPKEVQNRDAEPQWYDLTYVDKLKREAAESKPREATPQWYDLTYVDKKREEKTREADPQWYDLTYVDKAKRDEKAREAAPQWYDLTYVDKAKREEKTREAAPQWYDLTYVDKVKREAAEKAREAEPQWYGEFSPDASNLHVSKYLLPLKISPTLTSALRRRSARLTPSGTTLPTLISVRSSRA